MVLCCANVAENSDFSVRPAGFGKRHALAILGFLGYALSYSMRFNLSLAIVSMVGTSTSNKTLSNELPIDTSCQQPMNLNFSVTSTEPEQITSINVTNNIIGEGEVGGGFQWSESQQGIILASFFWGYILTQIPGGFLGHLFGGKWPFGCGLLVTAILTIVLPPVVTRWSGFHAIVGLRFLQGLASGLTVPSMHSLIARWIPPEERGQMLAIVYAGMPFGTALSFIVSGYIINHFGWPMVFYTSGLSTMIWFLLWSTFIYNSPSQHPTISPNELKYLQNVLQSNGASESYHAKNRPPWKSILSSAPFWGVVLGQTFETWGLYTFMTELPTYMKTVLHFDITENSILSAIPHLMTWAFSIVLTRTFDCLIGRRVLSIGASRKTCNTIALWGSSLCLVGVAYSGCNRALTVGLISLGIAATGGVYGGVLVSLIDIAPNYAGFLMGFTNTAATIPGFLAPWVTGLIIDKDPSLARWRLVFLITAAISFTGNLIFLLLSSGEEQPWNNANAPSSSGENETDQKNREKVDVDGIDLPTFYASPVQDAIGVNNG